MSVCRRARRPTGPRGSVRLGVAVGVLLCATVVARSAARAYTPESPEVRRMVGRAVKFLESDAAGDDRLGARAGVGLALLKSGAPADHPKIVSAAAAIEHLVRGRRPNEVTAALYSTGLSIIFLVTLDPSRYRPEIECLLESLRLRQKPHGGWGYTDRETGDTSMTQYAVLSSWEAAQEGFAVSREAIERVAEWLLRTQDPSGGFGYQGQIGEAGHLVKQQRGTQTMGAAGLGSTYICADLLGLLERKNPQDPGLPEALVEVQAAAGGEIAAPEKPKTRISAEAMRRAMSRGNGWMGANSRIDPDGWVHYYLYALERYWSFRELFEGRREPEPKWYNDGVRFLMNTQAIDGSWESKGKSTKAVVDTAFGVLFLVRSTKKSIEAARSFGGGRMRFGRGLPAEAARGMLRDGVVVVPPRVGAEGEFLADVENAFRSGHEAAVAAMAALSSAEAKRLLASEPERVRRLARRGEPAARLAAIHVLAAADDLESAPVLIAALGDADQQVARAANRALARLGRRPEAAERFDAQNEAERRRAAAEWRAWYLAIRPDAEFEP